MGHGTTHFKNTSIKPQVRAIDYILGQSKDDLVALVVRVEDDSIFVHLMRWIRVLLLALLTACEIGCRTQVACLAVPRGRSNFGDAVGGFNMKLSTDQIFKKNLLEQQVQMAMKSDSSREVYDDIMIAAHGVGAYRRILEGIDPPRLMQAREEMLSFLPAGTRTEVLEIGCGVGPLASNLPLYPAGISLTGLDPDVTSDLLWPCPEGLEFHAVKGFAESLPFPAAQFDAVVGSLVMCSVDKPQRMLTEIARVLKPKGRYLFLEHIHAPKGCALHWQQKILDPLHSYCCGCRLTRQQDEWISSVCGESGLFRKLPVMKHYPCHGDWPCTTKIVGYAVA
ncbi:unnamed protein product [Cladocopium goreaui]|uniref:Methyltransferase-like protein 7A n=1 Tax=Cladocopium goreaui TaxID=2562237 RepID=A0A9P1DEZ7_9DINO|nr:unnamed protein product [Cladocopium goreaui]